MKLMMRVKVLAVALVMLVGMVGLSGCAVLVIPIRLTITTEAQEIIAGSSASVEYVVTIVNESNDDYDVNLELGTLTGFEIESSDTEPLALSPVEEGILSRVKGTSSVAAKSSVVHKFDVSGTAIEDENRSSFNFFVIYNYSNANKHYRFSTDNSMVKINNGN